MEMENPVLKEIVVFAVNKLRESYGYCGAAIGEEMVMLNSDDGEGNDITISIKISPEPE